MFAPYVSYIITMLLAEKMKYSENKTHITVHSNESIYILKKTLINLLSIRSHPGLHSFCTNLTAHLEFLDKFTAEHTHT